MITSIRGTIIHKANGYLILENQGIGYKIFVAPESLTQQLGTTLQLFTYLKINDDAHSLYGFKDIATLNFFELLLSVSGIGPKGALGILSASSMQTIEQAISTQDVELFTRMSGIGKKTAERIILELKNKVGALGDAGVTGQSSDVFDALISLGYSNREVRDTISKIDTTQPMEAQLKEALKLISK